MCVANQSYLIKKNIDATILEFIVPYEELFDKIYDFHVNKTGHGGRCKIEAALADKFRIPRPPIEIFLTGCKSCNEKKNLPKKLVVKPILSSDFCERGQIDLIDFQSLQDGNYKWILNYQDHSTKFVILRPLTSKRAQEIASELLSIFLLFGAPKILQSDNGREFVNGIIENLHEMWPESKIVHGRPRHPQSQGSIERSNQDVENMLRAWMADTGSKRWSVGLSFVQWQKNSSYHRIIGRSPYKALFGCDPKLGLTTSNIPLALTRTLETEEDLEALLINNNNNNNEGSDKTDSDKTNNDKTNNNNNSGTNDNHDTTTTSSTSTTTSTCERQCSRCGSVFDTRYTVESDLCNLCNNETTIQKGRTESRVRMVAAAEKMLRSSKKKLPHYKIGDCVLLSIPKVDRGPSDPQNIVCVITEQKEQVNQVGVPNGIVKGWFRSENLVPAGSQFITRDDIDFNKLLSLREAVKNCSGGQGFFQCSCRASNVQCNTKRCACKKANVLCNSRCHSSSPCVNK